MENLRNVTTLLDQTVPEPYRTYIAGRNTAVARDIAAIIGGRFVPEGQSGGEADYFVPSKPLQRAHARALGIQGARDIFGSVVETRAHADKAILHRTVGPIAGTPSYYSAEFAESVRDAVLPWLLSF
jgi:hypothetical protein